MCPDLTLVLSLGYSRSACRLKYCSALLLVLHIYSRSYVPVAQLHADSVWKLTEIPQTIHQHTNAANLHACHLIASGTIVLICAAVFLEC